MNGFEKSFAPIAGINLRLLFGAGAALGAYALWPTSLIWWQAGLMSLCLAAASILLLIQALQMMARLYRREQVIADYLAQGQRPKFSSLARAEELEKAGMR